MNTRRNCIVVGRFGRRSLMRVCLLAAALGLAGVALAQASPGTKSAGPIATPAAQPSSPLPSPAKRAPKGTGEGIQVHGWWTIEVRNRDGSVAKHVEFENSLVTSATNNLAVASGSQALVALLSGLVSVGAPAGASPWQISLQSLSGGDAPPCPNYGNFCPIIAAVSPPSTTNPFTQTCGPTGNLNCLPNSLTLSGSVTPSQSGVIDTVGTIVSLEIPAFQYFEQFAFTSATLPQTGSGACGGMGQPPCAVTVTYPQTIQASVTLSFQ